ncbi:MAG TPA: methyltransferase domain-containing protein [Thermoanaerobaculia bacterium]
MSLLVPPRRPSHELIDDPSLPADDMDRSLRDLEYVNRRWGASRALARYLVPRMRQSGRTSFTLLDVGAGSGVTSSTLAERINRSGLEVRVVAVDLQWRHLATGRHRTFNGTHGLAADAFRLPLRTGAVDWVVSTLFFHHFSPDENVRLLKEFARVAREGFVLLDLRRHLFPLLFVTLASRVAFQSHASVHDGPASVRQAYTRAEAEAISREAIPGSRVKRVFPYRLLISGVNGSSDPAAATATFEP